MSTSIGVDVLVSLVDRLARPLRNAEATIAAASERMNRRLRLSMQVTGAGVAAAGVAYGAQRMVTSFTDSIRDVEQARGELATLGVRDLDLIVSRGRDMQAQWAGVTSAAFVSAAYDIRSGISSLTDQGVADMTAAATVMARATRSEIGNMTNLMAGAYGIYRRQFEDMTDAEWGDMFGAALSAAVQQFRTDGVAMQQAIQSAGAGATNLGMEMTEQLALLGMMQGQMQSGEAGTALASFARNAARAEEAFAGLDGTRVRLIDDNGQLRAMPDILADLTARYGETLEASEAYEIQQALGSDEAMRLVNALYGQEEAVRANEAALSDAAAQGAEYTEGMAAVRDVENGLTGMDLMGQKINVLWQAIGERLLPAIDRILPYIDAFTERTLAWIDANPELVTQIGMVVVAIGAIAAAAAPVLIALGGLIASWAVVSYGATRFALALTGVGRALIWMGRALLANPIGLAVAVIAGAAYLIYQNWEPVSAWFADLWEDVTDIFGGVGDFIGGIFTGDMSRAREGLEAIWSGLQGFFSGIWDGIAGVFTYAYQNWIRPVLDALGITDQIEAAWSTISGFFSGIFGDIGGYFRGLGEVVTGVLSGDMERARAGAQAAWEAFSSFVDRILTAIGGYFTAVWENVIRPVTNALGVTEYIETAWSAVQNALDSILNAIGSVFSTMWGVVEPIVDALRSPGGVGAAWQAVQDALAPVLDWIGRKFETVMEFIQPVLDALNWTLRNAGAAVAALGLGEASSVMDGREAPAPGDGAAPRPGTTTLPALTNGTTPYTSVPSAIDMLGGQARARGGAFRSGWLLTGEEGPELEYRTEGGFIAHNGQLRGMLAMAERTRAIIGGIDIGGIATAAVPLPANARDGAFRPGWLLTGEEGMEFIQPERKALNLTLDNTGAAVAALDLGDRGSVMDGREAPQQGDVAVPRPGTSMPPALTNGTTPYTSIPSAIDTLGIQANARGGAFRPGWLLTGEDGPELEYRNEGGFIAHTRALTGMLATAERTRAIMGGIGMGGIATAAVPALATVAAAAGPVMQRGPVTLSPTYNTPMRFEAGVDPEEIRATIMDVLGEMQDRAQAELRSVLHD